MEGRNDEFDWLNPAPCLRCGAVGISTAGYCSDCLADFISKQEAASLLEIDSRKVDLLLARYPEYWRAYPYLKHVRLSRREAEEVARMQLHTQKDELKWSSHFVRCRTCKDTVREHYGGGYCVDCYSKTNEAKIFLRYVSGENQSEIATFLSLSRERVRQLLKKAIVIEIDRMGPGITESDRTDIYEQIDLTYKQNRARIKHKLTVDENYDTIVQRLSDEGVSSESRMLQCMGLPASAMSMIEVEYPELLEMISHNKNRWSWKYDQCRMCESVEIKHMRWGYCGKCYTKSEEWRQQQLRYRTKNRDKLRERQIVYLAEYYRRPGVKERQIERSYMRRYDGKRESAIASDGYKCRDCGIGRDSHKVKYGQDLNVFHIDGNLANNTTDNLAALCKHCIAKRSGNLK